MAKRSSAGSGAGHDPGGRVRRRRRRADVRPAAQGQPAARRQPAAGDAGRAAGWRPSPFRCPWSRSPRHGFAVGVGFALGNTLWITALQRNVPETRCRGSAVRLDRLGGPQPDRLPRDRADRGGDRNVGRRSSSPASSTSPSASAWCSSRRARHPHDSARRGRRRRPADSRTACRRKRRSRPDGREVGHPARVRSPPGHGPARRPAATPGSRARRLPAHPLSPASATRQAPMSPAVPVRYTRRVLEAARGQDRDGGFDHCSREARRPPRETGPHLRSPGPPLVRRADAGDVYL